MISRLVQLMLVALVRPFRLVVARFNSTSGILLGKRDIMHLTKCTIRALKVRTLITNLNLGALIVYDITDLESWAKVNIWVKELQKFLPPETPILITGNKCDIPNRQIPLDEAER
jgi:hypothetical protein